MKTIIAICLLAAFAVNGLAQTNRGDLLDQIYAQEYSKTTPTGGKFVSHSKTVEAYRVLYPQLTNLTDERLVLAIGTKHPEFLKTDNVLSNEFAFALKNPYARFVTAESTTAAKPSEKSAPITSITTLDGETYTGVKIKKVDPDGLVISYSNGQPGVFISKVHFDNLPDSIRERFHYDPNQAAYFQIQQLQTMEELRQRLTVDDQIAVSAENQRIAEGLTQRQIEQDQKIAAQAAEAQQRMAEAEQKQADAAMIQALQPPPSVNMIQENNTYGW